MFITGSTYCLPGVKKISLDAIQVQNRISPPQKSTNDKLLSKPVLEEDRDIIMTMPEIEIKTGNRFLFKKADMLMK